MYKLAARDFEDLLQCAMPVFDLLLPDPHDAIVMDLLFELATWHGLAKLRMHTTSTLAALKSSTKALGVALRTFSTITCKAFDTRELPQEEAARARRNASAAAKRSGKKKATSESADQGGLPSQKTSASRLQKKFNMNTYKLTALGDYVRAVPMFGTTEGYSTQAGELEHRRIKRFYARTNKNTNFEEQITRQQRRERVLHKIQLRQQQPAQAPKNLARTSSIVPFNESEPLPFTRPEDHHHIANTQRYHENIYKWLYGKHEDDPALKNFLSDLKDHLLSRLLGNTFSGDEEVYTDDDRDEVHIVNNQIYRHKVIRVNYTTYDLRREQDSVNPRTHPDIMTPSHDDNEEGSEYHPYWYARVVGIFHVNVRFTHPNTAKTKTQKMEFLWVRWFGRDLGYPAGWKARRLHRIGFVPSSSPRAFGFLDPAEVIRGVHLIPAYAHGKTSDLLGKSFIRKASEQDEDWEYFYVDSEHRDVEEDDEEEPEEIEPQDNGSNAEEDFNEDFYDDYGYNFHMHFYTGNGEHPGMDDNGREQEGEQSEESDNDDASSDEEDFEGEDGEEPWDWSDEVEVDGYGHY
ncbi:hypothetical protein D9613_004494 [Agrocybe pediades]|uniref:Uncharacterized protein n=1 Tax=Agrocybe pediades TaxID=84607 RepID=A0A8H4VKQ4_9AGAR|nr:hypothetical protein D9613_004494 [Agrocybe pediades]